MLIAKYGLIQCFSKSNRNLHSDADTWSSFAQNASPKVITMEGKAKKM